MIANIFKESTKIQLITGKPTLTSEQGTSTDWSGGSEPEVGGEERRETTLPHAELGRGRKASSSSHTWICLRQEKETLNILTVEQKARVGAKASQI